ncbi:MAG: hypothetical protein ACRCTJ_02820 [Brevinema sp.]
MKTKQLLQSIVEVARELCDTEKTAIEMTFDNFNSLKKIKNILSLVLSMNILLVGFIIWKTFL